jgi:hypothetical protein
MLINQTLTYRQKSVIVSGYSSNRPMPAYKITGVKFDYSTDWDYEELTLNEIENFNNRFIGNVYIVDEEEELTGVVTDAAGYCIYNIDYEQVPSVEVTVYGLFCGETNTTDKRFEVPILGKKTDLAIIRAVKSELGWNNIRCHKQDYGDSIRLEPSGILQCADIEVVY